MRSAVIIARDEADRIGAALRSVAFCDECVVLDSGSSDATCEVAEGLGARVVRTDWPGYAAQKQRGLLAARGDWILSLDADEVVDSSLARAIEQATAPGTAPCAWALRRQERWLGRPMRGGHWRPRPRVRLVHRTLVAEGRARWSGEDPHDRLQVDDGVRGVLPGLLHHDPYRTLAEHLATVDRYTRLQARRGMPWDLAFRPAWHFLRGYVGYGGFRDGAAGLAVAGIGALHVLLKWSRGHWDAGDA
ncbi:MAG: hypothetical protein RLZZ299_1010 [Pseudomonadota bacterium]|jgi:glycosyltransferase involved in cell wall biosynthesis